MTHVFKDIPEAIGCLDHPPSFLRDVAVKDLYRILKRPTIIKIEGATKAPPLLWSTLVHGNEPTGFLAVQGLLKEYKAQDRPWPRNVYWFIGNVEAAQRGLRHLSHQVDFNRIWLGGDSKIAKAAEAMTAVLSRNKFYACVDLHNNTGENPVYSLISKLDEEHKRLAGLFSPISLFYEHPPSVQSVVFSKYAPSLTLECGKPGGKIGLDSATAFLKRLLHSKTLLDLPLNPLEIYETVARVRICPKAKVGFGPSHEKLGPFDVLLRDSLDAMNFKPILSKTVLGKTLKNEFIELETLIESCDQPYLSIEDQKITLHGGLTPGMLTMDPLAIRQDCLCYLLRKLNLVD